MDFWILKNKIKSLRILIAVALLQPPFVVIIVVLVKQIIFCVMLNFVLARKVTSSGQIRYQTKDHIPIIRIFICSCAVILKLGVKYYSFELIFVLFHANTESRKIQFQNLPVSNLYISIFKYSQVTRSKFNPAESQGFGQQILASLISFHTLNISQTLIIVEFPISSIFFTRPIPGTRNHG